MWYEGTTATARYQHEQDEDLPGRAIELQSIYAAGAKPAVKA
jgi:hypothetical protein